VASEISIIKKLPLVELENSTEVDAKTKESTRKTEQKLDGRNKDDHERKKPK
jgi:hypothetical protein